MLDPRIIPAEKLVTVTKSDATLYNPPLRALYVGVSGNVAIVDKAGSTIVLVSLAAGVFHPVCAVQVLATNTTATNIVGVYE
jgi:hypothetical protein